MNISIKLGWKNTVVKIFRKKTDEYWKKKMNHKIGLMAWYQENSFHTNFLSIF